eukprot:GAHX01001691.1.p1 GENE.GAHX01001691.1~~GAHX01001691.1.p1  ORF type:complete len:424 (-),score=95.23 GAHX01001691.1:293-1564(-)
MTSFKEFKLIGEYIEKGNGFSKDFPSKAITEYNRAKDELEKQLKNYTDDKVRALLNKKLKLLTIKINKLQPQSINTIRTINTSNKVNSKKTNTNNTNIIKTNTNTNTNDVIEELDKIVIGLDEAKSVLREACVIPYLYPELFNGKRKPWKSILLYGPPGTGKTKLVESVASLLGSTLLSITSGDINDKYQGESEKKIRQVFKEASLSNGPCMLFFDEIDSLFRERRKSSSESSGSIKTEFLIQLQKMKNNSDNRCVFIGSTNIPWDIDSAFMRRFDKAVYVGLPGSKGREKMVDSMLGSLYSGEIRKCIVDKTEGYSGSDMENLMNDIQYEPVRILTRARYFKLVCVSRNNSNNNNNNKSYYITQSKIQGGKCTTYEKLRSEGYDVKEPELGLCEIKSIIIKSRKSVSNDVIEKYSLWMDSVK